MVLPARAQPLAAAPALALVPVLLLAPVAVWDPVLAQVQEPGPGLPLDRLPGGAPPSPAAVPVPLLGITLVEVAPPRHQ